ncbi:autotransporter outer membrane beta-barrel domain-containing protein [Sphingosinicella sp. BN140058]|uniref:autotransporter outer membrane beta-barrel domain-containing protein n=1 Tax=Sphingosinicella sp. BN140058 TaxID=1892855 RepID=UPI0010134964|nr:autotransporter outer membrane beta-barrel domain-containing protein [Sphingosinicella sp. BN140058]QAY76310.1 autotransporter outer membrane beta-barrel domain-containing protein [Sphingosinicella sp. BN140058]
MKNLSYKASLRATAAVTVTATAMFAAAPASAACTTDASVVTCEGAGNPSGSINSGLQSVTTPNLSLIIGNAGAAPAVVRGGSFNIGVSATATERNGIVNYTNDGQVGTPDARVGIFYQGAGATTSSNSFGMSNTGTVTGTVEIFNVGGNLNLTSPGSIGGSVVLQAHGVVTAEIGGNVGAPASGSMAAAPADVSAWGRSGASLSIGALAGNVFASGGDSLSTASGPTTVIVDGVSSTTSSSSFTYNAGDAMTRVTAGGIVGSVYADSSRGNAAVVMDGTAGTAANAAFIQATGSSDEVTSVTRSTSTLVTGASTFEQISSRTTVGGATELEIGGTAFAFVNTQGVTSARVAIRGSVQRGIASGSGGVSASAVKYESSTRNFSSTTPTADGSVSVSGSTSSEHRTGGDAEIVIKEGASVATYASAGGPAGGVVIVDGTLGSEGNLANANADAFGVRRTQSDTSRTIISAVGTTNEREIFYEESFTGGEAKILVGKTGRVTGSLIAASIGGANITVAGAAGTSASSSRIEATSTAIDRTTRDFSSFSLLNGGGAASVTEYSSSGLASGGEAAIAIEQGASFTSSVTATGHAGAKVIVDGTVGDAGAYTTITAASSGFNTASAGTTTSSPTEYRTANSSSSEAVGGSASVEVTGTVFGNVDATGHAGANVKIAGNVLGTETWWGGLDGGAVSATSRAADTSSSSSSLTDASGSRSESASTSVSVGGAAAIEIGEGALVQGAAYAQGDAGASVVVDGVVGAAGTASGVRAAAGGVDTESASTAQSTGTYGSERSVSGTSSRASTTVNGGPASIILGATGSVAGNVQAEGSAGARIVVSGTVGRDGPAAFVTATSSASNSKSNSASTTVYSGHTPIGNSSVNESVVQAAGGLAEIEVASTGIVSGFVRASGDGGATAIIAGKVLRSSPAWESGVWASSLAQDRTTRTDSEYGSAGSRYEDLSTSASVGGNAAVEIAEGAVVEGRVGAEANSDASVVVNGAVGLSGFTSGVIASAYGASSEYGNTRRTSYGSVAGDTVYEEVTRDATTATGGAASVTIASTGTAIGEVRASGDAAAKVVIDGSVDNSDYFSPVSVQSEATNTSRNIRSLTTYSGNSRTTYEYTNESVTTSVGGLAEVVIGSAGSLMGRLEVSGDAGATASIAGMVGNAEDPYNVTIVSTTTDRATKEVSGGNNVTGRSSSSSLSTTTASGGLATVSIAGTAHVFGDVYAAGDAGATLTMEAGSVLGGQLTVASYGQAYEDSRASTAEQTGSGTLTRTQARGYDSRDTGGAVTLAIGGTVGGSIEASSNAGNVAVALTGTAGGGVGVFSSGGTYQQSYVDNSGGSNGYTFVGSSSQQSLRSTGGTATLEIDSNAALRAAGTDAVAAGTIEVVGVGGSALTIAAGSRVLTSNDGEISVGNIFTDYTYTANGTADGGQVRKLDAMVGGGPASLTNAGAIGAATDELDGYVDNPVDVQISSIANASAVNSGQIYGDVGVVGLYSAQDWTDTVTWDAAHGSISNRSVTRVYTPVGGTATLTNSGLIAGDVELAAATATATNSGVIRGTVMLGGAVDNFTSAQTVQPDGTSTDPVVTPAAAPFVQTYTLNQNGLLAGGVSVDGAFDPSGLSDAPTSVINATVNLNAGSVTLGNIVGDHDAETGVRTTNTMVNLVGAGRLGLSSDEAADRLAAFGPADPLLGSDVDAAIEGLGGEDALGARILGVNTVTKSGTGAFVITGAAYGVEENEDEEVEASALVTAAAPTINWTMDVGTFRNSAGEVQLGVAGADSVFGIRGNVQNDATLVLGRRVAVSAGTEVIEGIDVYQLGNFTQSGTGTLVFGMTPTLVRVIAPNATGGAPGDLFDPAALGFTTPANSQVPVSTPSTLTVDGNVSLAGTVQVATTRGALYLDGTTTDLFNVSGTFTNNATVTTTNGSAFLKFALTPRTSGGRTVVAVTLDRLDYDTAAANGNAAAAADALNASMAGVVSTLRANAVGTPAFALTQDLGVVMAALDTQLSAAQATEALNELSSGSFYGSLLAVSTTASFGTAIDQAIGKSGTRGLQLWVRPNAIFSRFDANKDAGASGLKANSLGGSIGIGFSTGSGGEFGIGAGYDHADIDARGTPEKANGETYMVGAYGSQAFGGLRIGAQAVFGWTKWDADRDLALFGRTASSSFDSKEIRLTGRVDYDLAVGTNLIATPFAKLELRNYDFDGFEEDGAEGIGLAVANRSKSVLSPELGLRLAGDWDLSKATVRPYAQVSYTFQGNVGGYRDVAFQGSPSNRFRLEGVDPEGFFNIGAGLNAALGGSSAAFIQGSYATGKSQSEAAIKAGLTIGF